MHHQTYNDIDAEQRGLVKMILEKKMSMDEYRNTSILYRTNKEAVQVSDLLITEKIPFWCTEPIQDKYDHWIYRDILSYHKLGNGIGNKMDLNRILNHPQRFLFDSRFFKTDGSLKQLMHVAATLPDGKWKRSKAMDSVEDMFYLFKKLEDKNPVDTLKIDRGFVAGISEKVANQVIVRSVAQCANELGVKVCVEGIEDRELADFLKPYGPGSYQGYYISRPISIEKLKEKYMK